MYERSFWLHYPGRKQAPYQWNKSSVTGSLNDPWWDLCIKCKIMKQVGNLLTFSEKINCFSFVFLGVKRCVIVSSWWCIETYWVWLHRWESSYSTDTLWGGGALANPLKPSLVTKRKSGSSVSGVGVQMEGIEERAPPEGSRSLLFTGPCHSLNLGFLF